MSDAMNFDYPRFKALAAEANAALLALSRTSGAGGVGRELNELLKIRASQINGCTFCTALHIDVARRLGVDQAKIDLVAVWHEADVFDARERAALAWAEQLTLMASGASREATEIKLAVQFSASEILDLTVAIGTINAWNRIAGGLRFPVLHAEAL
jgi:AhpD family alkylhydroperoxidase